MIAWRISVAYTLQKCLHKLEKSACLIDVFDSQDVQYTTCTTSEQNVTGMLAYTRARDIDGVVGSEVWRHRVLIFLT